VPGSLLESRPGSLLPSAEETLSKHLLKSIIPDKAVESAVYQTKVIRWPATRQFRCEWVSLLFLQLCCAWLVSLQMGTFFCIVFYGIAPAAILWSSFNSPLSVPSVFMLSVIGFLPIIVTAVKHGGSDQPLLFFACFVLGSSVTAALVARLRKHAVKRTPEVFRDAPLAELYDGKPKN
jgi:hypothetical protein